MDERTLQHSLRLACGRLPNARLFRNSVGKGYNITGLSDSTVKRVIAGAGGKATNITYGLATGSPDLIGWRTVNGVAQFVGFELKSATGRLRDEQRMFLDTITRFGGLAAEIRSVDEALELLSK